MKTSRLSLSFLASITVALVAFGNPVVANPAKKWFGKPQNDVEKDIVDRKLCELRQKTGDPSVYNFMTEAEDKAFESLKKTHPQFFRIEGATTHFLYKISGAERTKCLVYYDLMLKSQSPEAEAVRHLVEALREATIRILPKEGGPDLSERQFWTYQHKMWRLADRIYCERNLAK